MTIKYELRGNDVIKITTTEEKLFLEKLTKKEVGEIMKELIRKSNQTIFSFPNTFVGGHSGKLSGVVDHNRDGRVVPTAN